MTSRRAELFFLAIMALAVLAGGRSLLVAVAGFKGLAVAVLAMLATFILYAFRQNFRSGRPGARLSATRDAAFLATIAAAIAFVVSPARWSLGATVFGLEIGIVIEFLAVLVPPGGRDRIATGIDSR